MWKCHSLGQSWPLTIIDLHGIRVMLKAEIRVRVSPRAESGVRVTLKAEFRVSVSGFLIR